MKRLAWVVEVFGFKLFKAYRCEWVPSSQPRAAGPGPESEVESLHQILAEIKTMRSDQAKVLSVARKQHDVAVQVLRVLSLGRHR